MPITKIYGPPGTGKTTKLLALLEDHLKAGVAPGDIAFVSFTKNAANEAKQRAADKFEDYTWSDFYNFRTLHSFCYSQLNINRGSMFGFDNLKEFSKMMGLDLKLKQVVDEGLESMSIHDRLFHVVGLSRARMQSLESLHGELEDGDLDLKELRRIYDGYENYKKQRQVLDFTDLLYQQNESGFFSSFKVLFVDEAQDLSKIQWQLVTKLAEKAETTYIAGDDDQAIHAWAGADVASLLEFPGEVEILRQSYRIPKKVHELAEEIIQRVQVRQEKEFQPKNEHGNVSWAYDITNGFNNVSYLLLARNGYKLKEYQELCMREAVPFILKGKRYIPEDLVEAITTWECYRSGKDYNQTKLPLVNEYMSKKQKTRGSITSLAWFDAFDKLGEQQKEFVRACRRNNQPIIEQPKIRIETIHGSKGAEADHVVLSDAVSAKTYKEQQKNADNEHRVFYVGVTRAKQSLTIFESESRYKYEF